MGPWRCDTLRLLLVSYVIGLNIEVLSESNSYTIHSLVASSEIFFALELILGVFDIAELYLFSKT